MPVAGAGVVVLLNRAARGLLPDAREGPRLNTCNMAACRAALLRFVFPPASPAGSTPSTRAAFVRMASVIGEKPFSSLA